MLDPSLQALRRSTIGLVQFDMGSLWQPHGDSEAVWVYIGLQNLAKELKVRQRRQGFTTNG